jgi:predicted O-methyltransferase YrrM
VSPPAIGTAVSQLVQDLRRKLARRDHLPWMKTKELALITEVLLRLRPETCLEWGAGASTLHFPALLPGLRRWVSVEHQRDWYERVRARNRDPRVEVHWIPPDRGEYRGTNREGTLEDFRSYVTWPRTLDCRFDFIFIDGRARRACLHEAFDLLAPGGVVVLHDANRDAYLEDPPPFAEQVRLTDYRRRRGGVYLATHTPPLDRLVDVERQRRIWRGHELIARALFLR